MVLQKQLVIYIQKIDNMKKGFLWMALVISVFVLNLSIEVSDSDSNLKLKNLELVQASSGEYNCDKSNSNKCEGVRGSLSSGVLTFYDK